MKTLKQHLNEALVSESSKNPILKKLQKIWDDYNSELPIDIQEIIEFAKQALKSAKVFASDICDEISRYDDPDDLDDALTNGNLHSTSKFLDGLADIMADSGYAGKEGDYVDNIAATSFLYDFMNYMARYEK